MSEKLSRRQLTGTMPRNPALFLAARTGNVMKPYAVIEAGGKQYRVEQDGILNVEKIETEAGAAIELAPVLAISDGTTLAIGKPAIDGAKVSATVVKQIRAKKVVSFKKKRRKGYALKKGHRQNQTVLKITGIEKTSAA